MLINVSILALVTTLVDTNINSLSTKLLHVCVQIFFVNVLSTSGTPCLMMSVSTLFIGFVVVSCVLICLATLGIVVGLVDFHFVLSILRVLLILSRLFRATISVFFVPCCPVLLSFCLVLFYMFERNKWIWRWRNEAAWVAWDAKYFRLAVAMARFLRLCNPIPIKWILSAGVTVSCHQASGITNLWFALSFGRSCLRH